MIYFLKHLKSIAYLLTTLLLYQSCIAYKSQSSSVSEVTETNNRHIKIKTKDGGIYKLKWIEEQDGNVISILKTKREYVDKNKIEYFMIQNPNPVVVPLEIALKHNGKIFIKTTGAKKSNQYGGDFLKYKFIKIIDEGPFIKGYKMTGADTLSVKIPIENISSIQVESKGGTIVGTTAIVIPGLYIIGAMVAVIILLSTPVGF